MDKNMLSTHLQALLVNADHHLCVLALNTEAYTQSVLVMPGLALVIKGGGQRHRWREGKGQAGAPWGNSGMRTGVAKDGQLWRKHALQRIHHIWKSHMVFKLTRLKFTGWESPQSYIIMVNISHEWNIVAIILIEHNLFVFISPGSLRRTLKWLATGVLV